jgi:hypothetical protein
MVLARGGGLGGLVFLGRCALETMQDLTITLADRPGTLAKATEAIAKAGINLEGGAGFPCGGEGILHILTKDGQATRRALESAGFKISTEQQVVVIDVEDKPGTSASLYRRIADANVNVNLTYVATNNRLVVGADNIQKVKEVLTKEAAPAAARR